MGLTKTFTDGEVLTAADVNTYLVNNEQLIVDAQATLEAQIQAGLAPAQSQIAAMQAIADNMPGTLTSLETRVNTLESKPPYTYPVPVYQRIALSSLPGFNGNSTGNTVTILPPTGKKIVAVGYRLSGWGNANIYGEGLTIIGHGSVYPYGGGMALNWLNSVNVQCYLRPSSGSMDTESWDAFYVLWAVFI